MYRTFQCIRFFNIYSPYFPPPPHSYLRDSTSFVDMCTKLHKPDDMLVGQVIALLGYELTEVWKMQSHVENQTKLKPELLKHMVYTHSLERLYMYTVHFQWVG